MKCFPLYSCFRLVARPKASLFCYYVKSDVIGVTFFSIFVGVVLGDRPTAVMNVVLPEGAGITGKPRGVIAKPQKEKRPTVKLKITAGID